MSENPQDLPASSDEPPPQPYSAPPPPPPPPMGGQVPAYGQPGLAPVSPSDARMWSMLTHIGGIFFFFVPSLVIYLIYKDRDPFIRRHSAQALNFIIIMLLGTIVVSWIPVIGPLLWLAIYGCVVVFSIIAAMAANKGEEYTYPMVPQMVT